MTGSIVNKSGWKVEQLTKQVRFLSIDSGSNVTDQQDFIPVENGRVYEINQIRLIHHVFTSPAFAYPKFEQYFLALNIDVSLGKSPAQKYQPLFENLGITIIDGTSGLIVFKEPFIFRVTSNNNNALIINFKNDGTDVTSVTGYPPVGPAVFELFGRISFEGRSINITNFDKQFPHA